jgi:hypothetical protein
MFRSLAKGLQGGFSFFWAPEAIGKVLAGDTPPQLAWSAAPGWQRGGDRVAGVLAKRVMGMGWALFF